ncbi:hypothetical protein [Flammeovirga sp. SJP92]|uniref:hypothetical protein n=1 Tax=Flammeovirga sp. SJP92 TaxID=1775430 RepID=UPI000786CDDA|nr:hypothetical protein [Flammeovirga sp. SJP92]KXX72664.1 hypothetical protein AVL50_06590 [Flammeovirga sp. SJP92]
MNKWIYTAISALLAVSSAFGQEFDDMYFTKADREALSAKPAIIPMDIANHDFPNTPERQAQQSRFSNPDGVGTGYGYPYYVTEEGVIPSSIPSVGNAYMEATQGMSIAEQQQGGKKSGGFFSNPSVSLGMSAGTFGTGTSVGIGFGNNSAFSLGLGIGMGMGMGMYPGWGYPMYGYPMYGMRGMYGYPYGMGGMYPGYGYGGMYDPMFGYGYGYPMYGYPGYGYGRYPVYMPINSGRERNQRVAQRPSATANRIKYPERYRTSMATNGVGTTRRPSSSQTRPTTSFGSSRPSSSPFNNNSTYRRPTNNNSSFRSTSPSSMGGRSSGSAGRSVRRR